MLLRNLAIVSPFGLSLTAYPKPPLGVYFEHDDTIVAAGLMEAFSEPFFYRVKKKEPHVIRNETSQVPSQTISMKHLILKAKEAASATGSAKKLKSVIHESYSAKMTPSQGSANKNFLSFVFWCALGEIRWSLKPEYIYLYHHIVTPKNAQELEKSVDTSLVSALYKTPIAPKIALRIEPEPPCDWSINGQKWDLGIYEVPQGAPIYSTLACGLLWSQKVQNAEPGVHISSQNLPERPNLGETFEGFSKKVSQSIHIRWHLQKRIIIIRVKSEGQKKIKERIFPLDTAQAADRLGDDLFKLIFPGG